MDDPTMLNISTQRMLEPESIALSSDASRPTFAGPTHSVDDHRIVDTSANFRSDHQATLGDATYSEDANAGPRNHQSNVEDFSSSAKDFFDFEELLSDPLVLLESSHMKRSISAHDDARLHRPHQHHPNAHRGPTLNLQAHHSSTMSAANFQFGGTVLPRPSNAASSSSSSSSAASHLLPPAHPVASNHMFSRSVSTRNVSDLRRTRDKFFGGAGGGGGANTPLNALKALAQQRAAVAAAASAAAAASGIFTGSAGGPVRAAKVQVASVLSMPSNALLDALQNNSKRDPSSFATQRHPPMSSPTHPGADDDDDDNNSASNQSSSLDGSMPYPAPKKQRITVEEESALHRACCREGVTPIEIFQLLQRDPTAASRPEFLYSHRTVYDKSLGRREIKLVREPYKYALNLAIFYRQSTDVLDMLMNVAPDVLVAPDGTERENPLSVLIKRSPGDVGNVDRMLLLKPKCVAHRDRSGNTALHVAATRPTALDAVRHMCILYPEALRLRNRQGKTPLGVAMQYTTTCPETVANYLLDQQQQQTTLYYAA